MAKEKPRKKGYDYFEYFCASARYACQAAEHLEKSLANFAPETCREKLEVMHHIENAADGFRHDMTQVLSHEFIAPIEREDIIELAQDLDNVVDAIDDVMRRIYMFNVQTIRPEAKQFSALITKCCHALLETIEEFRHFKRARPSASTSSKSTPWKAMGTRCMPNASASCSAAMKMRSPSSPG